MKQVSFEVAKALKEAGYPQYGSCDEYYNHNGQVISKFCDINKLIYPAPTYLEVWLWLWREKGYAIECAYKYRRFHNYKTSYNYADPEEAIIAAIEHLVNK